MNVLIVDDNASNLKLLKANLETEDFDVFEAADGLVALEVLEKEHIDCVITDVLMPHLDGYGLCYRIRKHEKLSKIPVVVYTATHFSSSDKKLSLLVGADKFIEKPAPFHEILEVIRQATLGERSYRQSDLRLPKEYELTKQYSELLVRKLVEKNEELEEKDEKFRLLAENIREVFYILDPRNRKIIFVSPAYEEIWGETLESLYADYESWTKSIHPEDRQRVVRAFLSGWESGDFREEYRIVRPDGGIRWIWDRSFPVRNPEGNVDRIVGIAEDITERKNLESQLLQAQKMEAMGRLAGGIAHDFNNVLTVISGYTEMMAKSVRENEPLYKDLGEVRKATEHAVSLTRQLLLFSRRLETETKSIDFNVIISNIGNMVKNVTGENIEMEIRPFKGIGIIKANPGQIEQVILNMCINAKDAMPKGGRLILETSSAEFSELEAKQIPGLNPGEYVVLAITDTGCGMSDEIKAHLFEPFFTTKEPGIGTGLGLATSYGIIKRAGGAIWVDSYLDRGTTFKIFLPKSSEVEKPELKTEKNEVVLPGNETILIVEDEPMLKRLASKMLKSQGYTVLEAANGEEALKMIREKETSGIDLLFTDMVMPGINGLELAKQIKGLIPGIKILFTSGYAEADRDPKGIPLSDEQFIQKPFNEKTLLLKIREVLDQKTAMEARKKAA